MKKVQNTQSKALDNSTSVNNEELLKGQADEIRHMKRKKFEIAAELDKVKQKNVQLHEAKQQLQEQLRENQVGETAQNRVKSIDLLMKADPAIAKELKSVAKLQNTILILKKSNNSLRAQKSNKMTSLLKKIDQHFDEIESLKA